MEHHVDHPAHHFDRCHFHPLLCHLCLPQCQLHLLHRHHYHRFVIVLVVQSLSCCCCAGHFYLLKLICAFAVRIMMLPLGLHLISLLTPLCCVCERLQSQLASVNL